MALSMGQQPNIRRCILGALQDLPALPDVVNKILTEADRETATANQIEALARNDQALVAKILRVVNSAYYGLPGQVSSLSQAIVILGLHQVRNLVLSISALSMVKARTPRQREILKAFWLHGMATASGAQAIARQQHLDSRDVELAYIGGMLHDVGKLFLFCNFTDTYQEVVYFAEAQGLPMNEAELSLLGMDHQEVGQELAIHWRYPEPLTLLISRHEGPFAGAPTPALYAVHAADRLASSLPHGQQPGAPPLMDPAVEAWLAWNEDEPESLKLKMEDAIRHASELFGMIAP